MTQGPTENASLFTIVWSTCVAIAVLLFGRISDKFGRRWFVIIASCVAFIGGEFAKSIVRLACSSPILLGIIACTAKNMDTLTGANVCHVRSMLGRLLMIDRSYLALVRAFTPAMD